MRALYLTCLLLLSTACAHQGVRDPDDPLEGFNRKAFAFNQVVDHMVFMPIAKLYSHTPRPIQKGVDHFVGNIQTLNSFANSVLQFRPRHAVHDFWRFVINTTFGIGGLLDPATHIGIPNDHQDFGQTLARWGFRKSPYLVIPIIGPSTVRDGMGFAVDHTYLSAINVLTDNKNLRIQYQILRAVNHRSKLLPAGKAIAEAFDPYIFVRNAYLQKRRKQIDGALGITPKSEKAAQDKPAKSLDDSDVIVATGETA